MRNQRVFIILTFFLFINLALQFSVLGSENWYKVKTSNFTLIGNTDKEQIKKVGIKLEQFRESLRRLVPHLRNDSPISTTVIVFKDNQSFHPYKPLNDKGQITEWVSGYFQSGLDINYIAIAFGRKDEDSYQTIFHEYTHYLIDYNLRRSNIPPWYGEGLAEFYDKFTVEKDRVVKIGGRNDEHIKILKANGLIPLDKFFQTDYKTLRLYNKFRANLFYAQSWALMHYFIRADQGRRKTQIELFLKLIMQKQKPAEAFKQAFDMNYEDLERKLSQHIKTGNLNAVATDFNDKLTNGMKVSQTSITLSEVEANLGDLLYQRARFSQAEDHLKKALQINPDQSFANSTLGLVRLKQKRFAEAEKYMKRAIKFVEQDYLIFFRYAFFLSRETVSINNYISSYTDERTRKMKAALNKSISLNPVFPESYNLLGFINLVRNENIDEGITHFKKALEISPGKQNYLLNIAELYLRQQEFEKAKIIAENITRNPDTEIYQNRAELILRRIKRIENEYASVTKDALSSDTFNVNKKDTATKNSKALTEEELERNRKQTESEAISEVLRRPKIGEIRIVGKILDITCSNNRVIITISTENELMKLKSADFKRLRLMTYIKEMRGVEFGCGTFQKEVMAVLTYKPIGEVEDRIVGEVVAIEFVPDDFVLAINQTGG